MIIRSYFQIFPSTLQSERSYHESLMIFCLGQQHCDGHHWVGKPGIWIWSCLLLSRWRDEFYMFFEDNARIVVDLKGEMQKSAITELTGRIVLIFGMDCSSYLHPVWEAMRIQIHAGILDCEFGIMGTISFWRHIEYLPFSHLLALIFLREFEKVQLTRHKCNCWTNCVNDQYQINCEAIGTRCSN